MNGILESKNDKNEEKRIRVVEIFRVFHLIIYISRVYRKSGTNAEITGYRQLDGSTSYDSLCRFDSLEVPEYPEICKIRHFDIPKLVK